MHNCGDIDLASAIKKKKETEKAIFSPQSARLKQVLRVGSVHILGAVELWR